MERVKRDRMFITQKLAFIFVVAYVVSVVWIRLAEGGQDKSLRQCQTAPFFNSLFNEGNAGELWRAICIVESGNNPKAIGDNGNAVGIAQIWPVTVAEANRILGRDLFTNDDRNDPRRSRLIFDVFMRYWGEGQTVEWCARAWNGGPSWQKREKAVSNTAVYWSKIKAELESL